MRGWVIAGAIALFSTFGLSSSMLPAAQGDALTHRILLADFYLLETENRPPLPNDYIWIKESEIEDYGVPRLIEIMLEKINPAE